jgi:hypothetical protein
MSSYIFSIVLIVQELMLVSSTDLYIFILHPTFFRTSTWGGAYEMFDSQMYLIWYLNQIHFTVNYISFCLYFIWRLLAVALLSADCGCDFFDRYMIWKFTRTKWKNWSLNPNYSLWHNNVDIFKSRIIMLTF